MTREKSIERAASSDKLLDAIKGKKLMLPMPMSDIYADILREMMPTDPNATITVSIKGRPVWLAHLHDPDKCSWAESFKTVHVPKGYVYV